MKRIQPVGNAVIRNFTITIVVVFLIGFSLAGRVIVRRLGRSCYFPRGRHGWFMRSRNRQSVQSRQNFGDSVFLRESTTCTSTEKQAAPFN
jgi:hypothetical protein